MGNLAPFTLSVTAFLIVSLGLVYWLASSLYPHTPPSMVEDYIGKWKLALVELK
eukprot:m.95256 g.95256  ORF g.95256 m.95256 type:complete len:54 (-) comp13484_c0_seq3:4900-5061(-)